MNNQSLFSASKKHFYLLFSNQEPIEEATNTYTKRILRLKVDEVFLFEAQGKRINKIPQLASALQKTYI